jgi:hypothetical protein
LGSYLPDGRLTCRIGRSSDLNRSIRRVVGNLEELYNMKNNFFKFIKGLTIYTLIILSVGVFLFLTVFKNYFLLILPFVLLFYYVSTLILHKFMLQISQKDISRFSFKFMMLSLIKMFIYIIFGVLYIVIDEENAVIFLVVYLILYVAYAVYEVRSVMNLINESKS